MRELLPEPIIIPGQPLSRANISLDYKLAKVPYHRIKNPTLAAKKLRWEKTNQWKDQIAWSLSAVKPKILPAKKECAVGVMMDMVFKYKSGDAQRMNVDMDNVEKVIYDAIQKSGVVPNDKQIVIKLVGKKIHITRPRLAIYSIVELSEADKTGPLLQYWGELESMIGVTIDVDPTQSSQLAQLREQHERIMGR